jgi:transcriptional regulator with XRE-family HTH domain
MLTLKDIAQHVGVSASTVSLVLNDRDRGRVNVDVAERIRRAADEMGYVPNLLARSLKTKQSHTIGVLSDGVASIPFAGPMLRGAQATAWNDGYLLMLIDTGGRGELDGPAVKSLMQRNIEGLILATEFHRFVDVPLVPSSIPTVVLDGTPSTGRDDLDSVVPDEEQGAFDAVRFLLDHGHRRIAHVTVSDPRFVARKLRLAGYERAMAGPESIRIPDSWSALPRPVPSPGTPSPGNSSSDPIGRRPCSVSPTSWRSPSTRRRPTSACGSRRTSRSSASTIRSSWPTPCARDSRASPSRTRRWGPGPSRARSVASAMPTGWPLIPRRSHRTARDGS